MEGVTLSDILIFVFVWLHSMDYVLTVLSSFYDVRYQSSNVRVRVHFIWMTPQLLRQGGRMPLCDSAESELDPLRYYPGRIRI